MAQRSASLRRMTVAWGELASPGGKGTEERGAHGVWRRSSHACPWDAGDSSQQTGTRAKGEKCGEGPGPQSTECVCPSVDRHVEKPGDSRGFLLCKVKPLMQGL